MARLSKRKKTKSPAAPLAKKPPFTRKNEIWLLSFIAVNLAILVLGFNTLDFSSLLMYTLLVLALGSIYVKRKFPVSLRIERYLDQFGMGAIGIAFLLFLYVLYQKFTA